MLEILRHAAARAIQSGLNSALRGQVDRLVGTSSIRDFVIQFGKVWKPGYHAPSGGTERTGSHAQVNGLFHRLVAGQGSDESTAKRIACACGILWRDAVGWEPVACLARDPCDPPVAEGRYDASDAVGEQSSSRVFVYRGAY